MEIVRAEMKDIPTLSRLLSYLFEQEAEFSPDTEAQEKGLRLIIDDPRTGDILIMRESGHAVGMVNLLYTVSTALGGKVAVLEDMVVAPEKRGTGTGKKLLGAAVEHAKKQGCMRITLLTDTVNEKAQRFYERHGFTISPMLPMRLLL
ncbi:GNAT family N-acetyltransferase [Geovibrio thiophilus]|uniref:GNAT family N-acetyltransferase n=1 Tax=Geovibrio thiophilus TaxID=139438 RepID=A0A410JWT0_9BACT|nr:GNAT family N-acetyltransferase [Geovibrio thiophilus]QAR32519.1 GNAT family N-acetyltransferase [Geovibrio thiophilus]